MVSHGNWKHLMGNFIYGFPYMLYLEYRMNDWKKFLKAFFFCGWVALLGQFLISKFSVLPTMGVIGSSGAIFGLVAFALCIAKESKIIRWLSLSLLAFHIYTQGYSTWMSMKGYSFGIAFGAHLFGIFAGMYCAWKLTRRPKSPHRRRVTSRSRK
jgi:membrane associated rhomboid family serine protease